MHSGNFFFLVYDHTHSIDINELVIKILLLYYAQFNVNYWKDV